MIVGVSRVKQFLECKRQWWLGNVAEVPLPHSYAQVFGNVLHATVERWLNEEDLHPPGWQWCPESKVRVDKGDDDLIQELVAKAVEKGYLRRHPQRFVERTWWKVLGDSADRFEHALVAKGTIDLSEPGVIVDHKTSKNVANWSKTKAELREDLQLLVYAYVNENMRGIKHLPDDKITVGHLNYCRTTRDVTEKNVTVLWSDCKNAWVKFYKAAASMVPVAQIKKVVDVPCALDEPAEADGKRVCDKYAGCGYLTICSQSPKRIQGEFEKFRVRTLRASLPSQARADFQESVMAAVNKPKGKAVKPSPFEDEDEDEAPAPKAKAKRSAPAPEPEEDEDEAPAPNFTDGVNAMKAPELRERLISVYHVLTGVLGVDQTGV